MTKTKRKTRIAINNRSQWPDEFVTVVVPWICEIAGIEGGYGVVLLPNGWCGTGGSFEQRSHIARRMYKPNRKWTSTDGRMKWTSEHRLTGNMESFVYLISHEAHHATKGHPREFRNSKGRVNKQSMEWWCNHWAHKTVVAFRKEWPRFKKQVARNFRRTIKARKATERAAERRIDAKKYRMTDEFKLATARKLLRQWETKRKLAATKTKK